MKPTRTYILVADNYVAKFYLNRGPSKGVSALPQLTLTREKLSTASATPDRPGRVFDSNGDARHAMVPRSNPEKKQAQAFLKLAMGRLKDEFLAKKFERFILVAPPASMAQLRKLIPDLMQSCLRGELVKDLTKTPASDLSQHLDQVFPASVSTN